MSAEAITLAVAPKVGGLMSVFGSTWICMEVLSDREKRTVVYHRLMFMLSFFDIIVSSAAFASTWSMIPDGVAWHASGNQATCSIQGFALQLGSSLFTYNAFLSIFYVLVINFNVPDSKLKRYEWSLHIIPILFGLVTAIVPLANNWYHNANLWCWIAEAPECRDEQAADSPACAVYKNIHIYRWVFFFAPLWFCFALQLLCLCFVFRGVRRQEKQSLQYQIGYTRTRLQAVTRAAESAGSPDQSENPASIPRDNLPRTRQVGGQAVLYICAFYMTYIFATINRILQQATGSSPSGILIMHSLSLPMQGFWNLWIYRRPHYLRLRRAGKTRFEAAKDSLVITWFRLRRIHKDEDQRQAYARRKSRLSRLSISSLSRPSYSTSRRESNFKSTNIGDVEEEDSDEIKGDEDAPKNNSDPEEKSEIEAERAGKG